MKKQVKKTVSKKRVTKKKAVHHGMKPGTKCENFSQKLGLERLAKSTPKTCRDRAALIEKLIEKGKVPAKSIPKAKRWASTYRTRAKSLAA